MSKAADNTVITESLRALHRSNWQQYRVLYFCAPCGVGKTSSARALLKEQSVFERSAAEPDFLSEPLPENCDTVLIDDFQYIRDADDQQKICTLINENPAKHFVFLSRGILPGWLMPYQFTGLLATVDVQALLFDRAAVKELLDLNGCLLSDGEISELLSDTKGYPLLVSTLCRILSGGGAYTKQVLEAARREVFHYLEEAVYRRFEVPMRRLLLALSPFEQFDSELARLVSGDGHVNDLLGQILHETTMLSTSSVESYSFWPFFRRFLRWELEQDCTQAEQRNIYSRAGLYYELHDDWARALECYTKSGEHSKVSALLVKNAEQHPGVAHYYELEQYYYAIPREEVLRSPSLMCGMSMLTALCLDFEASEQWYTELQGYAARLKKTDSEYRQARGRLAYLDIALPQRGSKGIADIISSAFKILSNKELIMPALSVTSTLPSIMNGGKDFCEWSKKDDLMYATLRLPVEAILGRDGVGLADCGICESKFEKGEDVTDRLLSLMSRMNEIRRKGTPDIAFAVVALLARAQTAQGRAVLALQTLENLRADFTETGQTRFLPNLDAMRCRIWLRCGETDKAVGWLRGDAPSSVPRFRALWRYRYITKALVQLSLGEPQEAMLGLAPLLPYCERCERIMDGLHIHVIIAICQYRLKNDAWRDELETALNTASEYRFIRPVAQYGAAVLPLLNECAWKKNPAYFERLVAAVREETVLYPDFLRPASVLSEPLTPAETQVLRLLCFNRSNQEIADILGVKLPTVKTQVRSILQKLGVSRRSEAKDEAERLHLI